MILRNIFVYPRYPESLKRLFYFAYNLWSLWDNEALQLFNRIDAGLFRSLGKNPVRFLHAASQDRFEELARDQTFLHDLDKLWKRYDRYLESHTEVGELFKGKLIAYFSMEYGLHQSLPTYAGGLGMLAGDHLKGGSDLGLPIVGVGLFYRYGYFQQKINVNGFQEEEYVESSVYHMPVKELNTIDGESVYVDLAVLDKVMRVKVWLVNVGRVRLLLLDTNLEENPPEFRTVTDYLYDARRDVRLLQELLLGFGGMRALEAMQIKPDVFHLNEGHSAFLIVQRMKTLMLDEGYSFEEAHALIKSTTVFTTHTPVEAGNENFPTDTVEKYLKAKLTDQGALVEKFLRLGFLHDQKTFWLPALAMRSAKYVNGVSKIHADVSRGMWHDLFPHRLKCELPIINITNGVHHSWLSEQMRYLFERYLGPDYPLLDGKDKALAKVLKIPDEELWEAHTKRKREMIAFLRNAMEEYYAERGYSPVKIRKLKEILNPHYLTVGFARRFTAYKRPTLILKDKERLKSILLNPDHPVQIIFSGKAHPADTMGKNMIKEIIDFAREYGLEDRVVFIENYDRNVASHLVQGVDVWLNTPLKPFEASGTSGMKVGMNGGLNLSIMDGWWPECYNGRNGWEIKSARLHDHAELRDTMESNQIYDLLEEEIAPLFYERDEHDIPREWVTRMKQSIYTVYRHFNINRMLEEYSVKSYHPAVQTRAALLGEDRKRLREIIENMQKVRSVWDKIYIKDVVTDADHKEILFTDDQINIECYVFLDDADPALLEVQLFYLLQEEEGCETPGLRFVEKYKDKVAKYECSIALKSSGIQSFGMRVVPADRDVRELYPELVKWRD
jgi:starch phosphorylase